MVINNKYYPNVLFNISRIILESMNKLKSS